MWITDKEESGTVVRQAAPRSYLMATPRGTFRRNRRHLNSEAVEKEEDEREQSQSSVYTRESQSSSDQCDEFPNPVQSTEEQSTEQQSIE